MADALAAGDAPMREQLLTAATASVHVVTLGRRHAWRSPRQIRDARRALDGMPGTSFTVCGRTSGGSGTRRVNRTLSPRRMIAIVEWATADAVGEGRRSLDDRWRAHAEVWSASLAPFQAKGTFNGVAAFTPSADAGDGGGVVASLTYAQVRPSKMAHFYVLAFPKTARRATAPDSAMFAGVGFGDVPIRHACTFSLWPSSAEVARFGYAATGVHGPVQVRSREQRWLSESLFARFHVVDSSGSWSGIDPLR